MTIALRNADVLVFEQRAQLVEVTMEYRVLDEWYSTADTCVLQRTPDLTDPLATLTLAAAIAIDLVLKQDESEESIVCLSVCA